ncbi:PEP-CTERM sorting domain-containing protein [Massilia sp. Root418]|uniref:PEP-CTERM sorting domain-containing protein n=1 Tax=Massilia sp. Root418 TaxID=1736532 RepID=UPI0006F64CEC|nr:PEP-CTERM sorting domain-containing protein [Massilia sp. Root418]
MQKLTRALALLGVAALSGSAMCQEAALVGYSYIKTDPAGEVAAENATRSPVSHAASLAFSDGPASGSTYAFSEYGILKGRTNAAAGWPVTSFAYSRASFQDNVVINFAGHEGETGFADIIVYYNWQQNVSGNAASYANITLNFNGAAGTSFEEHSVDASNPLNNSHTISTTASNGRDLLFSTPASFAVRADFRFGVAFSLGLALDTQTSAYGVTGESMAAVFADKSAYWGGIDSIFTTQNDRVLDYALTSDSGIDYRQSFLPSAVPEPATSIMCALGLGIMALHRRRSRQRTEQ